MMRAAFLLFLALGGCTTASTTMLSDNSARIVANDLSTDSPRQVRARALRTAALAARAHGFDYFGVTGLDERIATDFSPVTSARSGSPTEPGLGISSRDLSAAMTVRFLRASELPANRDGIYRASDLLKR